ncbi:MAG TPA: BamA/TamA family outer membrane protein [Chryseolinea sp.]|nr:BamA/TamA family outer membrane protein [Chryseolinea sp.]
MQKKNNIVRNFFALVQRCRIFKGVFLLIISVVLSGCTATKFLKENESFYGGAEIKFDTQGKRVGRKKILEEELQEYIQPKPNKKFLGMRPGVWFYFIAGTPKKEKGGLRNFIKKKLGKPPVLFSEATPDRTAKTLNGQLHNEGYFQSKASFETKTKRKETKVIYNIILPRPYRLDTIRYPRGRDSVYASILTSLRETSLLKEKQRYDLGRMQAEQARIEKELENEGFYYFDDRYLIFEADSTVGKRKVHLQLRLEKGIPRKARRIYKINDVNIYASNTLLLDSTQKSSFTQVVDGYNIVDSARNFRPQVITRLINLKKGNIYRRDDQELTLSHLMGLGVFKFVNIKFSEVNEDSLLLNADIHLTPLKKKSLRTEVQMVSKSNNFVGPGLSFTFSNRNFLRGGEMFQLRLNTSYEVQVSSQTEGEPLNAVEVGLESSLTVPRFMTPFFDIDYNNSRYIPKTVFRVGLNVQNRVGYYRLNSFSVGYGYNWLETASKAHELYPIDISYVKTDKKSEEFQKELDKNPVLENSFQNQFIVGTRYSYTLNTQLTENTIQKFEDRKYRPHNFYFNGTADVAGNFLYLFQDVFGKPVEGPPELLNSPYSPYIMGSIDVRHYWTFDPRNKLASRIILGAGYAYKDSTTLPYVKQFSIGGSNSIRAFPARSLGPGTYNVRDEFASDTVTQFIDQRGDIKLEANLEYRFDITKIFKGAIFLDGGNIWLLKQVDPLDSGYREGGSFNRKTFLKELAIGTGFGLRLDFSFFVLRLDTAFPLRKPWLVKEGEDPWVIDDINFGSSTWRKENLIFNIAIGYPF